MRLLRTVPLLCAFYSVLATAGATSLALSDSQQRFRSDLSAKFSALEQQNAGAELDSDGWLFLTAEFRLLSAGRFWGDDAAKVGRSTKPELADPVPAILDFNKQLKARGITLLLVPVPPKAAIYPDEADPSSFAAPGDAAPFLHSFYEELRASGVDVLDLTTLFLQNRNSENGPVYCKTDTHWSGAGCVLAAHAIAEKIRSKLGAPSGKDYVSAWKEIAIDGDLVPLLPPGYGKPGPEKIRIRTVSEKGTGAAIAPDPASPILLIGDSHTLVFHDFLAERAGLLDQLALELGTAPDLIGTRGSGATPVRVTLYRNSVKKPDYLASKRVVIWCFTAREFTEAAQGWAKVPVAK